jgi:archaellum component FlaF (FlaF/FlaG flagellin family)
MQKKYLAIIFITFCILLNIIFAGALIQKTDDSAADGKTPTVSLVYSFPPNTTITNAASSSATPEKIVITDVQANDTSGTFLVTILNNDSAQTTISDVSVNGNSAKIENSIVIPPKACAALLVSLNDEIVPLKTYEIQVESLEGDSAAFYKVCW